MSENDKVSSAGDKSMFKHKSAAGKGDAPRNISKAYWDNYDQIKGFKKSKYK